MNKLCLFISILILFGSCQLKKETNEDDILQMILDDYYDRDNNKSQHCIYIHATYHFEKDIYHFIVTQHLCNENEKVKTASYKNKTLYLTENLPLDIQKLTKIKFNLKTQQSREEEIPDGKENFNINPSFFYTITNNPNKILKIVKFVSEGKPLEYLYENQSYKEPEKEKISNITYTLMGYLDSAKLELRGQNIYMNNELIEDREGLKSIYFREAVDIKNKLHLNMNVQVEQYISVGSYHTLNIDVSYEDSVKKTFEIPLNNIRYNEDFEALLDKIINVENEDIFLPKSEKDKVYKFVQQKPFPNYSIVLLSQKMTQKYPQLETKVRLQFIVERDGSLSDITFLDKGKLNTNQESYLVNTLKNSGSWNPAKQNDSVVRMEFKLPLNITPE